MDGPIRGLAGYMHAPDQVLFAASSFAQVTLAMTSTVCGPTTGLYLQASR